RLIAVDRDDQSTVIALNEPPSLVLIHVRTCQVTQVLVSVSAEDFATLLRSGFRGKEVEVRTNNGDPGAADGLEVTVRGKSLDLGKPAEHWLQPSLSLSEAEVLYIRAPR